METVYSTGEVEVDRRFDYWIEVVCRQCIPAASRPLCPGPFDGRISTAGMGVVEISTMRAPLHEWERGAAHIRRNPDDDLWIACMRNGDADVTQAGCEARLHDGDLLLYDAAQPFLFRLAVRDIRLVRLPRRALLDRCAGAEHLVGRAIGAGNPSAAALRSLILDAGSIDTRAMQPDTLGLLGDTVLDLAGAALEFQLRCGSDTPGPADRDLHARLLSHIGRHLGDPDLNLETLAHAHGVSTRSVTRAFARLGQTAMGVVWRMRLEACHRALQEGRGSVTQIAFEHGFSDASHFSRAFRRAFGCAPRTIGRN